MIEFGGVDNSYPFVKEGWTGNDFGDTFLGAKFNLMSESRQNPVAVALRGMLKVPTGSADDGSGTGKMDFQIDGIVSKEVAKCRGSVRQHRIPSPRRSRRIRSVERHPIRYRRAVPDPQRSEVHD